MRRAAALLLLALAAPAGAVPTFLRENTISLTTAAPLAFSGSYPTLRMYYMRFSSATDVYSAVSADGHSWTVEESLSRLSTATLPSVSVSSFTGFSLLPLDAGGFRAVFSIVSTTGAFRLHTATSADGLAWANETPIVVDGGSQTFVGSPALVELNSGDWRLYYLRDADGGNEVEDRVVLSARSTDQGVSWDAPSVVLSTAATYLAAVRRTDGRVRLFLAQTAVGFSSATMISSALSDTVLGSSFLSETGVRVSTPLADGSLSFPAAVRSTDTFRWRLYYSASTPVQPSSGVVASSLMGPPDPQTLSPSTVFQTGGSAGFTLRGEGFSATPSVLATRSGFTSVAATGETRSDDQTITLTLDMTGQELGPWTMQAVNDDGAAGTGSATLTVDYAPASIQLTDNLIRPRNGGAASIETTIFTPGGVSLKLYTLDGRLVRTLFDGHRPGGTFTVTWDGRDAQGVVVPSGLYVVRALGPKLDARSKVLVIK